MCDAKLGNVLDIMDELDLWRDTMLIVWTDHGFLLGENDCWGKCWMPFYNEIANTPFFVWDPRSKKAGERRGALVQPAIDLPLTLLEFFGVPPTHDMLGKCLRQTIASDQPVRPAAIFGEHGRRVNVTDGRYVYMRGPVNSDNTPLNEYTLMPAHMRDLFAPAELQQAELSDPFSFTKRCPTLRIPSPANRFSGEQRAMMAGNTLFDLATDPKQQGPITDPAVEREMIDHLVQLMRQGDAPAEQFERLGLLP